MLAVLLALSLLPACAQIPGPEPDEVKLLAATPTEQHDDQPASSPTVLPARAWVLGVPTPIFGAAERALSALQADRPEWDIQLKRGESILQLFEAGEFDLAVVPDATGLGVWDQPIALAVPLTSEWEDLTLEQAQAILVSSSPFIAVRPWAEMTPDLRALRVDGLHPADLGYPLVQPWSLHARPGTEQTPRGVPRHQYPFVRCAHR